MNDVQRLEIKQDSFYQDALILLVCKPKEVSQNVKNLAQKYKISVESVYYRIRTKYGKPLADVRFEYRQPNKDTLIQILKLSQDSSEVQSKLNLTDWEFKGIYDRILNVSTFSQARLLALKTIEIQKYNPSPKDNASLIYGMRLGDGSFDKVRKAMRIEHSYKQLSWLQQKVDLFVKAYPYVSNKIVSRQRSFGITHSWYSKKLEGSALSHNEIDKVDMARNINQFGLFVLFLDDGNLGRYNYSSVLGFAVENEDIGNQLCNTLKHYGFSFKLETKNYIAIKKQHEIQMFLNDMILPFNILIPDVMKYKTILKV